MRGIGWKGGVFAFGVVAALALAIFAAPEWIAPWTPDPTEQAILYEIRLPRAMTAFAVGALLALSGCALQTLLGNPLAEPYVLGAAGSGALGAVAAILWLSPEAGVRALGACIGALLGTALVGAFARFGVLRLLLAGVVLASFWAALLALLLALLAPSQLAGAMAWLMGDLASQPIAWPWLWLAAVVLLAALLAKEEALDRLLLGERHAAALGEHVALLRRWLLWLASIATGIAVAAAGTIGFVGLVVPHAVRLVIGARHRQLLPIAALAGGAFLACADALARTLAAPHELPVGVITALVGVPLFLRLLLHRERACWPLRD